MNRGQEEFAQRLRALLDKFEKGSINRQQQELEDFVYGANVSLTTITVPDVFITGVAVSQQLDQLLGFLKQPNWKVQCLAWLQAVSLVRQQFAPQAAVSLLLAALYNQ